MSHNGTNGHSAEPILEPLRRTVEGLKSRGWIAAPETREQQTREAVTAAVEPVLDRLAYLEKLFRDWDATAPHVHLPEVLELKGAQIAPTNVRIDTAPIADIVGKMASAIGKLGDSIATQAKVQAKTLAAVEKLLAQQTTTLGLLANAVTALLGQDHPAPVVNLTVDNQAVLPAPKPRKITFDRAGITGEGPILSATEEPLEDK